MKHVTVIGGRKNEEIVMQNVPGTPAHVGKKGLVPWPLTTEVCSQSRHVLWTLCIYKLARNGGVNEWSRYTTSSPVGQVTYRA